MEEVKRWWKKAVDDLEKAEILYKNKKYDGTVFYCQQAVEKGLKALQLKKTKKIKKIHDLVELGISRMTFLSIVKRLPYHMFMQDTQMLKKIKIFLKQQKNS